MPRPTPLLRRAVGATLAAAVSVGGLSVAAAPAAHAEPTGSCTASFDKTIVRPGETAVLTAVAPDAPHYVERLTVDGHLVPTSGWSDWAGSTVGPLDYAWWSNWADGGETVGFRFYTLDAMDGAVDDSTPYECGAEIALGSALTSQTIDFPAPADQPLSEGSFGVTVSSDSGLLVKLTSKTPTVCEVDGANTITLESKGQCIIGATQAGNDEYAAAAEVERFFWVQAAQTITFPPIDNTPLSAGHLTLDAVADSGRSVTYTSDTPEVCAIASPPPPPAAPNDRVARGASASTQVDLIGKGQCHVVAHQNSGGEYAPTAAEQWFWVQAPQTLTFSKVPDTLLSAGTVQLDASASSGNWISYTVADPSVCDVPMVAGAPNTGRRDQVAASTLPQTTLTLKKVGTCTVTALQPGGGAYLPSNEVTRSFKVYKNAIVPPTGPNPGTPASSVKLNVPAGVALSKGTARFSATPRASVSSSTPSVCAVASANSVKLAKAGTCTLTATQAGAASVTKSFPVWGAPAIPKKGKTTQTIPVLGKGESSLHVTAKPAAVCRVDGGDVAVVAPGTCKVRVEDHGTKVRGGKIEVAFVRSAKPAKQLKHGGQVRFAFNSAVLTQTAKKALHRKLRTLRQARTVIVYGNTFGPGKNSAHSRRLASNRAAAVVGYLEAHGIEAKTVTVAAAMQNPISKDPAKNRRADIYYLR